MNLTPARPTRRDGRLAAVLTPVVTLVGALVLALVAPASAATAANAATAKANKHDVGFVAAMVPHHEAGIEMAELARTKASNAAVRALAARIDDTQTKQVAEMRDWLKRHDASPASMPKAVRDLERQDLQVLRAARGEAFDGLFLIMMRRHHAQAVSEADDELRHGGSEVALGLARTIRAGQLKEIGTMNGLLGSILRAAN